MAALHRAETFVDTLLLVTDAQVNCQTRAPGMTTEGRSSDVEAEQATQQVRFDQAPLVSGKNKDNGLGQVNFNLGINFV